MIQCQYRPDGGSYRDKLPQPSVDALNRLARADEPSYTDAPRAELEEAKDLAARTASEVEELREEIARLKHVSAAAARAAAWMGTAAAQERAPDPEAASRDQERGRVMPRPPQRNWLAALSFVIGLIALGAVLTAYLLEYRPMHDSVAKLQQELGLVDKVKELRGQLPEVRESVDKANVDLGAITPRVNELSSEVSRLAKDFGSTRDDLDAAREKLKSAVKSWNEVKSKLGLDPMGDNKDPLAQRMDELLTQTNIVAEQIGALRTLRAATDPVLELRGVILQFPDARQYRLSDQQYLTTAKRSDWEIIIDVTAGDMKVTSPTSDWLVRPDGTSRSVIEYKPPDTSLGFSVTDLHLTSGSMKWLVTVAGVRADSNANVVGGVRVVALREEKP